MVLSMALPFCSTLWFYSQRRKQIEERLSCLTQLELSSSQVDVENQIDLIQNSSSPPVTSLAESLI